MIMKKEWMKRIVSFALAFLLAFGGIVIPVYAEPETEDDGLVAYWDFENINGSVLPDASGNGHTGEILGNATTKKVDRGNAMYFDGVDDAVDFPYSEDLNFSNTDSFTLSVWISVDSTISSGWHMICGNGRASTKAWYGLYYTNGEIQTSINGGGYISRNTIATVAANEWHQVTLTYDGNAKRVTTYFDGTQATTTTISKVNPYIEGYGFSIGFSSLTVKEYFKGSLDNIRVYNRTLSEADVKDLYLTDLVMESQEYPEWTEAWPENAATAENPVNIIFDSDCGPDIDDGGALAMLHHYADIGKANLLAMVCSTSCQYGAPWLDAVNTYYGRPDIPIGTLKTKNIQASATSFNKYTAQHWENDIYNGVLAPDAIDVYRETLAKAEDNSVTIVVVGMLTNLSDLLNSRPDQYSNLTGYELVQKKVKLVSCMGGAIDGSSEFNIRCDVESAQNVADNWPTPIVFSGYEIGLPIKTGGTRNTMEEDNPIRVGYDLYCGKNNTRSSWDLTSVLFAVEGLSDYWTMTRGDVKFMSGGKTYFRENEESGARAFLVKKMADGDVADVLNTLMTAAKKNNPDEKKFELVDASPNVEGVVYSDGFRNDTSANKYTYNDTLYYTNKQNASISFTFTGYGVDIYAGMNNDNCIVDLYLDGEKVTTLDLYSAEKMNATCIYSLCDLPYGEHTVQVISTNTKNESSKDVYLSFDYFKVYNDKVDYVMGLIGKIGSVTLEDESAINDARAAYESLSEEEKALVIGIDTLVMAEVLLAEQQCNRFSTGSITENENGNFTIGSDDFSAFISAREAADGKSDLRIVLAGEKKKLALLWEDTLTIRFFDTNGLLMKSVTFEVSEDLLLYQSATAAGNTYVATEGCALFGVVICGVPNEAWGSVSVTLSTPIRHIATGSINNMDLLENP